MQSVDLIVIGAGPAGMAAARRAADAGVSVLLLDEQPNAGGQIYRDVDRASVSRGDILGRDFSDGRKLTEGLKHDGITHLKAATVWQIEEGGRVAFTQDGRAAMVVGKHILLATGALERPMPLPGWTLPGVMTAGSAQILLKQSGIACEDAVLVGSGPLLYLVASQMVRAGVPPKALVETQTKQDFLRSLRHFGGALRGWRYLLKGLGLLWTLRRAGVPRFGAADSISVDGVDHVTGLSFRAGGRDHHLTCQTVLLHHGVVPNTQAARSLDIPHRWDAAQSCFAPDCDSWGRSAGGAVFIAGDGARIGGAKVAILTGEIAALAIACDLGKITESERDAAARPLHKACTAERAVRPFLDAAYPSYAAATAPQDDTIICRCEEVTAGDIRRSAKTGCLGPNQTKAFVRAGMGPCQGRYCGLAVTQILSQANTLTPDETGYYRIRPPLKPVTLGEIAAMSQNDEGNNPKVG